MSADIVVAQNVPEMLTNDIKVNSSLRKDEYEEIDAELIRVSENVQNGQVDLVNAGLVHNVGSIGITESKYERVDNFTAAEFDMDISTSGILGKNDFDSVGVNVPVIFKEFKLNQRQLLASRSGVGEGLDVTSYGMAGRVVNESIEKMIFNGVSKLGIFGYTTHPNRNLKTIANAWNTASGTPIADTLDMIQKARNANKRGPYVLYVADNVWVALQDDYSATKGDNTVMQRLLAIPGITAVKEAPELADSSVLLVQMDRSTVDLAIAEEVNSFDYSNDGGRSTFFRVQAVMTVRVKAEKNGQCGIVHGTV